MSLNSLYTETVGCVNQERCFIRCNFLHDTPHYRLHLEQPRPTCRTRIPLQPSGFLTSDCFWNRDLVQHYAFPASLDIFRCFVRQERSCSSAVHPPPHCIIPLIHIQKAVTKEQSFQLQINIVIGLLWLFIDKLLTVTNFYVCSQLL